VGIVEYADRHHESRTPGLATGLIAGVSSISATFAGFAAARSSS
jgi:hypothetical protein